MEHAPTDYVPDYSGRSERSPLGCMIGAALCGLSAMLMTALFVWLFLWATEARAHDAIPTALWAKRGEA